VNKVQTTEYLGCHVEVELETRDKQGVHSVALVLPKVEIENRARISTNNLLETILARDNMLLAMKRVISNKGSHGVDGMKYDELRDFVIAHWHTIKLKLLKGTYNPSPVRRVEIPKPNGGIRLLGIPTVLGRMIQQAIAQVLTKIYEPTFSNNSYGFRPGRSQHQAIKQSLEYINQGNKWVVDMDLEKFFDSVNHDILIEEELKLKVNETKSAVDLVTRRKFLGFTFYFVKGEAQIRIHKTSYEKFKFKLKEITNRNKGISMDFRLFKLNEMTIGWINYFGIAKARR